MEFLEKINFIDSLNQIYILKPYDYCPFNTVSINKLYLKGDCLYFLNNFINRDLFLSEYSFSVSNSNNPAVVISNNLNCTTLFLGAYSFSSEINKIKWSISFSNQILETIKIEGPVKIQKKIFANSLTADSISFLQVNNQADMSVASISCLTIKGI